MTLQESYRDYYNSKSEYKGALSYYIDQSLTPYQRIEMAKQSILDQLYEKEIEKQLDKQIESKLEIALDKSLGKVLDIELRL